MREIQPLMDAFEAGRPLIMLSGRSLDDLVIDADARASERPRILTIRASLRRALAERNVALVDFSLSAGLDWNEGRYPSAQEEAATRDHLQRYGLLTLPLGEAALPPLMHGLRRLLRDAPDPAHHGQSQPRIAVMLEHIEHIAPAEGSGARGDAQLIAIETLYALAGSRALRQSGNLLLLHGRPGLADPLVSDHAERIRIPLPDAPQKRRFLSAARSFYPRASLAADLSWEEVAHVTAATPNTSLDAHLFGSERTGRPLTSDMLVTRKREDVLAQSEGTLALIDTRRVMGVELVGLNARVPVAILGGFAAALARGDENTPINVLLAGAPGVGKTDLAVMAAAQAKAAAFQMLSPKAPFVGETERKARLQQTILLESAPNVAWVDEITEAMPMTRGGMDTDSGASRAVQATLLTSLSDVRRRGKSMLIAATNRPQDISDAMASRFEFVPVLRPLPRDLPAIIRALAVRASGDAGVTLSEDALAEAAARFTQQWASPRHIGSALSRAMLARGRFTDDTLLHAARNAQPEADPASVLFAELQAIRRTSDAGFFPWAEAPQAYPFPSHLQGIVDPDTGALNWQELDRAIASHAERAHV